MLPTLVCFVYISITTGYDFEIHFIISSQHCDEFINQHWLINFHQIINHHVHYSDILMSQYFLIQLASNKNA